MNNLSEIVLVESKSARDIQIVNKTHEDAESVLTKAKALIYFAMYRGDKIASTEQVAEFYEVSVDVVRDNIRRHRDEFESDGVKVLKGKALKDVREILSLSSETPQATAWNLRGTLRLGMLLRDSEVAKAVRTGLLDTTEESGKKSERIQELEIERDIAQAQAKAMENERLLFEQRKTIYEFHGETGLLVVDGKAPIEIERPTLEVIDDKHKAHFKGQTLKQVAEYVKKRYGVRLKNGGSVAKILKSAEKDSLIAHVPRAVVGEYIPQEHLQEVYRLVTEGSRQMLLGE